jgi:hypothetical protein
MADQAGMMAVNRAVEALADDPAPLGAFVRGAYREVAGAAAPTGRCPGVGCAAPLWRRLVLWPIRRLFGWR